MDSSSAIVESFFKWSRKIRVIIESTINDLFKFMILSLKYLNIIDASFIILKKPLAIRNMILSMPPYFWVMMISLGIAFFSIITCLTIVVIRNYRRLKLLRFRSGYSNLLRKIIVEVIILAIIIVIAFLLYFLIYYMPFAFIIGSIAGFLSKISQEGESVEPSITILKEKDWKSVIGRVGPILTLIGAILFLIDGAFWVIIFLFTNFNTSSFYELMCGIMGILGIYFGFKRKEFARFLCLIAGILGVAGLIIPFPKFGWWYNLGMLALLRFIFLDYVFIFLFLIGGLLSVASENRYLNYYLEKSALKDLFVNVGEEMDRIDDLESFLKENLSSDWEKIKASFTAFKTGELEKALFIEVAVKNIGEKFLDIFRKPPNPDSELEKE